jgi:epoxyqueuosine reductase
VTFTASLRHDLAAAVKRAAEQAGFELSGIAPVAPFPELDHLASWIDSGRGGEMKYLEARDASGTLKRSSVQTFAPWARSVIVCAINYNTREPRSIDVSDRDRGWISRYAWGREDYHRSVLRRLQQVEKALQEAHAHFQASGSGPHELILRSYVDTGPIVERVYAKYAGVGWIGKNTCILNQKSGSWLFLGVILTSLELEPDIPAPDRCGTCTRCITACPTDALTAPYQMDATRCISYLTIEKRGDIPEDLRPGIGRHVFGCDICQDVCPWNRKAPATAVPEFQARPGLVNPALHWLAEMREEEFQESFRGSAVRRTKLTGMRRNAVVAMGNSRDPRYRNTLEALCLDSDIHVAEHARWALSQLPHAHGEE